VTLGGWRYAATRADAIIAYSDDYAAHSRWLSPWRGKVVVNAPPIRIPAPDAQAVAAMRRDLNPDGGPIIGFAGRFAREKRPDLLLDAIAPLRVRHPRLRVVFAGEQRLGYEDTYAQLAPRLAAAAHAVRFLGLVHDPQVLANFYAACDVLALPSDSECLGLVQVEAMLCGTPVVASDIPGARVAVMATGAGRLFASGSVASLVAALEQVIENRAHYLPDATRVASAFDYVRTIDTYERVFAGTS
jgi:glycosyltransferase involved in cell wall biosynthesis